MRKRTTVLLAAGMGVLALADAASAYYNPRMGRFLSRDPLNEPGAVLLRQASRPVSSFVPRDPEPELVAPIRIYAITSGPSRASKQFQPRDPGPTGARATLITVVHLEEPSDLQDPNPAQENLQEMNLYEYARSSPLVNYDPLGLSTTCGTVTCACSRGTTTYTVKGDSKRAKTIIGTGCVTLPITKEIVCSGSCADIKNWNNPALYNPPILNHECCHACANHDGTFACYLFTWIPGDLVDYCDKHAKNSKISW